MVLGFAAGYYVGTMAGRERYEQINKLVRKAQQSSALDQARSKAKPIVDRGKERVRSARGQDHASGDDSGNGADSTSAAESAAE